MAKREYSDEAYVLDLVDGLLGLKGVRQKRFQFLRGGPAGAGRCLPVDAFYEEWNVAVEYRERQHSSAIAHFDKPWKLTISGVHRGEQRKIYDQRRREILPLHGIKLVEIEFSQLAHDDRGRLRRNVATDQFAIRKALEDAGVKFTDAEPSLWE
jgi:hypothetical protein